MIFICIFVWIMVYVLLNSIVWNSMCSKATEEDVKKSKIKIILVLFSAMIFFFILHFVGWLDFSTARIFAVGVIFELLWFQRVKYASYDFFWKVQVGEEPEGAEEKIMPALLIGFPLILINVYWIFRNAAAVKLGTINIVVISAVMMIYVHKICHK